ncbi:MAG: rRNA maturation RNase YbeY [Blastocatellia bacterium]
MSTTRKSASEPPREEAGRAIEALNRQRLLQIDIAGAARLSRAVLDRVGREDAALTLTFLRDRRMRRLNRDYRGIDKSTDVLSFAYHETEDCHESKHLGDVVIAVETAQTYARELGLTFEREIEHLVIHGTLHLAGYDHETDGGEMNRMEKKLRKDLLKKLK